MGLKLWDSTVLYCTVRYSTVRYCIVLCCTVLCSTLLHYLLQCAVIINTLSLDLPIATHTVIQPQPSLDCNRRDLYVQYSTVHCLYCIVLYSTVLVLYSIVQYSVCTV